MNTGMSVSIVILSYNHPDLTARCVQSVKTALAEMKLNSQLSTLQYQIYLVHNGSLPQHKNKLQLEFPELVHLVLEKNRGFSGGANHGLNVAFETNERVLFLTNDCELLKLSRLEGHGMFGVPIELRKTGKWDSWGAYFNPLTGVLRHCWNQFDWEHIPQGHLAYIPGTAFWLDRNTWIEGGGFDESLSTYWEDVDLSVRLQQKGISLKIDPTVSVRHAVGKTCHSDSFYSLYLYQRNRKRVSAKYCKKIKLPVLAFNLLKSYAHISNQLVKHNRFKDFSRLFKAIIH